MRFNSFFAACVLSFPCAGFVSVAAAPAPANGGTTSAESTPLQVTWSTSKAGKTKGSPIFEQITTTCDRFLASDEAKETIEQKLDVDFDAKSKVVHSGYVSSEEATGHLTSTSDKRKYIALVYDSTRKVCFFGESSFHAQ